MTDRTSKGPFHPDEAIDSHYHASRKLWSFGFWCSPLNTHNHFDEELRAVCDRLRTLVKSDDIEPELVPSTRILHVLKSILRLAHIPQKELQLKERSFRLLEELTRQHGRSLNIRTGQKVPPKRRFSNWSASRVCQGGVSGSLGRMHGGAYTLRCGSIR